MSTYPGLERILYAEDEDDIRQLVEMALVKLAGLTVKSCSNGREVLDCLQDFKPQLVLLDAIMPTLDGPDTLRALRDNPECATLPVVFMTAKARQEDLQYFIDLGASAVITKPFDPLSLSDRLQEIWERHHAEQ